MRHVSAQWSHMDRKQKEPYNEMAAHDKSRYDKQLVEFTHATDGHHNADSEFRRPDSSPSEDEEQDYSQNFSNHQFNRGEYPSSRKESATKDTTLNLA